MVEISARFSEFQTGRRLERLSLEFVADSADILVCDRIAEFSANFSSCTSVECDLYEDVFQSVSRFNLTCSNPRLMSYKLVQH